MAPRGIFCLRSSAAQGSLEIEYEQAAHMGTLVLLDAGATLACLHTQDYLNGLADEKPLGVSIFLRSKIY